MNTIKPIDLFNKNFNSNRNANVIFLDKISGGNPLDNEPYYLMFEIPENYKASISGPSVSGDYMLSLRGNNHLDLIIPEKFIDLDLIQDNKGMPLAIMAMPLSEPKNVWLENPPNERKITKFDKLICHYEIAAITEIPINPIPPDTSFGIAEPIDIDIINVNYIGMRVTANACFSYMVGQIHKDSEVINALLEPVSRGAGKHIVYSIAKLNNPLTLFGPNGEQIYTHYIKKN